MNVTIPERDTGMRKRVLVIDDDIAVREAFELALEDSGHDIVLTDSGESGIANASGRRPDMVFLDLKMPGMDGVEVLRRLNRLDPEIPVYIVTAFHQEFFSRLNDATEDGIAFELARKPLSGSQIRAIAQAALG